MKKMQQDKICTVCGKEYTPRRYDQLTCSAECRTVHNYETKHKRDKDYYTYKPTSKCKICGKTVINSFALNPNRRTSATMHDECVFEDCRKTLEAGETLNHVQLLRLQARGYTIPEFKEEFMGITTEPKEVDWSKIGTGLLCLD